MNTTQQGQGKGLFYVILSGFLWAVVGTISKFLLNDGSTPVLLILTRNFFGLCCLTVFLFFYNKKLFHVDREDIRPMILCCIVMFIYSASYFFCIYFLNVSLAVMLLYLYPSMVAAASVFLYREKLTLKLTAVLLLTLLGLALTLNLFTEGIGELSVPGLILGFGAAIGAAGYCICVKGLSAKYHAFTINFYGLIVTIIGYSLLLPFFDLEPLEPMQKITAMIAAFPYLGGFILYSAGVKYLKPSFASIFGNAEAVFNVILAALLLGEAFSLSQGFGMVLIIGALVLLEVKRPKQKL